MGYRFLANVRGSYRERCHPKGHRVSSFVTKLENFTRLSASDRAAAESLGRERLTRHGPRSDVVREGEPPRVVRLIVDGWASRYKQLEDGRRQIVALFLPGDVCDLNVFILREMDHSIAALTPLTVANISRGAFEKATASQPRLLQALWWESLVNVATQREWAVNLGSRTAYERILHLLCEVFLRSRAAGLATGDTCPCPITQATIADITGLSAVHVSRTFNVVRDEGLVELQGRVLRVPDLDALMAASLFNPNYLHLDRDGCHLDANDVA